ncbi:MAG TPA: hypothetical protein VGS22_25780 [Thermoanaerobaculia bacterium]|nr:hypothetical protein [Thermoanaerobaculia bacterium]
MRRTRPTLAFLLLGGIAAWIAAPLSSPLSAQQVSLSLERFQKLWDQAHPKPPEPPPPTVPLAVESARISIAVGADSARLSSELTVVLDPGKPSDELVLALPGLGSPISVTAAGCEAAIDSPQGGSGADPAFLRLRGTGRHTVTVESALPVPLDLNAVESERHLEVTWPAAAWVTGTLAAGDGIQRIEAQEGGAVAEDGPGKWRLIGDPGARLRLRLFGQAALAAPAADEPISFDVDTASALAVSRARRRVTSFLEVHIRGGRSETFERLSVPIPAGYEVIAATGDRVADWEVKDGALAIRLRRQTGRDFSLQVQLAADPAGEIDSPVLVPTEARTVRAARKVAVRGNDGLLEPLGLQPIERLAVDQLDAFAEGFGEAPGEPLRAEAGRPSPLWRVTWATGGEVLTGQIDRLVIDVLIGEAGTAHYQLWAEARNGEAALVLGLPAGARLLEARRDGIEVTPGRMPGAAGAANGAGEWALPMVVREAPQVAYLEALIDQPFPIQGGRLTIPLPRLGIPASRVEVRVAAPPGFLYTLAEPGRAGQVSLPPGSLSNLAQPSWLAFLEAPPGFSVIEASWAGWSTEPPPLLVDVKPLSTSRRDR